MIETAYGRKFPDLLNYLEGNAWIENYNTTTRTRVWKNKKSGEVLDQKPPMAMLKNPKVNVPLPTRPFIYSSKAGTWSSPTFENGDEDYFDEVAINGYISEADGSGSGKDSPRLDASGIKDLRRISAHPTLSRQEPLLLEPEPIMEDNSPEAIKLKHHSQMGSKFVSKTTSLKIPAKTAAKRASVDNLEPVTPPPVAAVYAPAPAPMQFQLPPPPPPQVKEPTPPRPVTSERDSEDSGDGRLAPTPPTQTRPLTLRELSDEQRLLSADEVVETDNLGDLPQVDGLQLSRDEAAFSKTKSVKIFGGFNPVPYVPSSGALDPSQKNKEYFRRIKEQEEEEKRRKAEEESQMDATSYRALKEAEAEAKQHDQEKSKHYAKLGSTFAVRGNALTGKSKLVTQKSKRGGNGTGGEL